jgi:2-C-methyl-D-erythritol 4-phosphate cytidylyltransferase
MQGRKKASVKTVAIVPAAGFGVRMGSDTPKQFLSIDGVPILAITLRAFHLCNLIDAIVLVVPVKDVGFCRKAIVEPFNLSRVIAVAPGGERRQDSVRLGLEATEALEERYDLVVIHDGVRPVISPALIDQTIEKAMTNRAVITGLPSKETVKEVNRVGEVVNTYDRKRVWLIQTPQVFRYEDILLAHKTAWQEGWEEATDDASLIEKAGVPVKVTLGSQKNIKVTTPEDLKLARFFLRTRTENL